MKIVAVLLALVSCLSAPLAAAEDPASPTAELESLFDDSVASPIPMQDLPYCWDVEYYLCPRVGMTKQCTDVCGFLYTCTCKLYYYPNGRIDRLWDCPYVC